MDENDKPLTQRIMDWALLVFFVCVLAIGLVAIARWAL